MSAITLLDTQIHGHAAESMQEASLAMMLSLTDVIPSQPLLQSLVMDRMTLRCKTAPPTYTANQTVQSTISKTILRLWYKSIYYQEQKQKGHLLLKASISNPTFKVKIIDIQVNIPRMLWYQWVFCSLISLWFFFLNLNHYWFGLRIKQSGFKVSYGLTVLCFRQDTQDLVFFSQQSVEYLDTVGRHVDWLSVDISADSDSPYVNQEFTKCQLPCYLSW